MNHILFLFMIGLIILFGLLLLKSILETFERRKHFTLLRTHPQEIPLYDEKPRASVLQPSILTRKISRKGILLLFGVGSGIFLLLGIIIMAIIFTILLLIAPMPVPLPDVFSMGTIIVSGMIPSWIILGMIVVLLIYQRIETTETGLIVQRGMIRRYISWDEARLFAVDHKRNNQTKEITSYWDELSREHKVVRWEYVNEMPSPTLLQFTPANYQEELENLRSYICQKTSLPLQDLRHYRE